MVGVDNGQSRHLLGVLAHDAVVDQAQPAAAGVVEQQPDLLKVDVAPEQMRDVAPD